MKTLSKLGLFVILGSSLFLSSCAGEYYVTEQPEDINYYRPDSPPFSGAIWIGDDWVWREGRYVHLRGHWGKNRDGRVYVHGSWYHGSRGYAWRRGHWESRQPVTY